MDFDTFSLVTLESLSSHEKFNINHKTVFYIHGFRENMTSESVETIVNAYTKRSTYNILVLDWSEYSNGSYVTDAVPNLVKIGKLVGENIFNLVEQKVLELKNFHVVGHSLGGQMAGYIGRWMIALSRGRSKLARITALDPAKPLFYEDLIFLPTHLTFFDAEFVDIIHSDALLLGASVSSGNVDFWPNGGSYQPGCRLTTDHRCDHSRSWKFFAESVASFDLKFDAIKCESFEDFKILNCSVKPPLGNMGIDANPK
ncbi:CLUMA_CG014925, isoform A [Clunio marinus]|uniref:CLUMA_CG014925, isoform A n=1 Tax=Clunio marinus TaxID=568069 RepID=A0A1J1INA5_9DIPT|nr:CLUMA_CG014925, isoform A [Clunio marinus]